VFTPTNLSDKYQALLIDLFDAFSLSFMDYSPNNRIIRSIEKQDIIFKPYELKILYNPYIYEK